MKASGRVWIGGFIVGAVAVLMLVTALGWTVSRSWPLPDRERTVAVERGGLVLADGMFGSISFSNPAGTDDVPVFLHRYADDPGYYWWFQRNGGVLAARTAVPLWWLALPGLALIGLGLRTRWRARNGRCACGYDLAGLSGVRCPECGGAVQRRAPATVSPV
jgi:hypothetical protein